MITPQRVPRREEHVLLGLNVVEKDRGGGYAEGGAELWGVGVSVYTQGRDTKNVEPKSSTRKYVEEKEGNTPA